MWIDFDAQSGHKQAERGLALVIYPLAYNEMIGL